MRRQKAVYWRRLSADEYGRFSYDTPVEIDCRWEKITQEFRNMKGEMQMSDSIVYVDRSMSIGDMLRRGAMDSSTPDDPRNDEDAHEIQRFDELPDFKAKRTLYTAYL